MNEVFEKIGKTISEAGQAVSDKTKNVIDIAKINCRINTLEQTLVQDYTELGKTYFENNKENPDESVSEIFNEIVATNTTISDLKAQLASLKGVVTCSVCGKENALENNFCGKCGAKLEKPEPPVEEAVVEEETAETTEDTEKTEESDKSAE